MSIMNRVGKESADKRRAEIEADMAKFTGEIQVIPNGVSGNTNYSSLFRPRAAWENSEEERKAHAKNASDAAQVARRSR